MLASAVLVARQPATAYAATAVRGSARRGRRLVGLALTLGAHLFLLIGMLAWVERPPPGAAPQALVVRLIAEPSAATAIEAARRAPSPRERRQAVSAMRPVGSAADAPSAPPTDVAAPSEPAPAPQFQSAPTTAPPVTAAHADADYLANPKPAYPPISRRLGEEGRVVLRVQVGVDGLVMAVEVAQSCGFPRLDASAKSAVEHWRFVPAQRGGAAVESWLSVSIVFSLRDA